MPVLHLKIYPALLYVTALAYRLIIGRMFFCKSHMLFKGNSACCGKPSRRAVFSSFLEDSKPAFPFLSLIVSGGHTCLYRIDNFSKYRELGRTRDDAAGEAYDKVSKLLGLGYPGGPVIDTLAMGGNPKAVDFPRAYLPESLDFSFSGLKTAVLHYWKRQEAETKELRVNDIAASFQAAVIDVLVRKTEWAVQKEGIRRITLSGGVTANSELRRRITEMAARRDNRNIQYHQHSYVQTMGQ